MRVRLGLLLVLLFGALVTYLTAVNPSRVRVALSPSLAYELPVMALAVGAFLAGVCVALFGVLLRDLGRSFRGLRVARAAGSAERLAEDYRRLGRIDDALDTYRQIVQRDKDHATALRAIRELTGSAGRWEEALEVQERLVSLAADRERPVELGWLAGIRYEIGKARMSEGKLAEGRRHFSEAVRADRTFLPAHLALGETWERAGERREAIRIWRHAADVAPAPVLLQRLEQAYRAEARPSQMIALYREALDRAPQDLALAFALGRVYFELEMLDEAADQFQKLEVRAPDLAPIHAFLAAIYERRGHAVEAFEEYRGALRLAQAFDWPHRCSACGAAHARWYDRCPACGRWNTSRP